MARRVAVRRQEQHGAVAEDVVLTVEHPVLEGMVEVHRARAVARHEARPPRRLQLRALHQKRRARKELVAAAVNEVQMRVGDIAHVVRLQAEPRQLRDDVVALARLDGQPPGALLAEPANGIEARLAVHAGVAEEAAARMVHEKAPPRHRPRLAGREVGQHAGTVEFDVAGAEGVDLHDAPASTAAAAFSTAVPLKKSGLTSPQKRTALSNMKSRKSVSSSRPCSTSS